MSQRYFPGKPVSEDPSSLSDLELEPENRAPKRRRYIGVQKRADGLETGSDESNGDGRQNITEDSERDQQKAYKVLNTASTKEVQVEKLSQESEDEEESESDDSNESEESESEPEELNQLVFVKKKGKIRKNEEEEPDSIKERALKHIEYEHKTQAELQRLVKGAYEEDIGDIDDTDDIDPELEKREWEIRHLTRKKRARDLLKEREENFARS